MTMNWSLSDMWHHLSGMEKRITELEARNGQLKERITKLESSPAKESLNRCNCESISGFHAAYCNITRAELDRAKEPECKHEGDNLIQGAIRLDSCKKCGDWVHAPAEKEKSLETVIDKAHQETYGIPSGLKEKGLAQTLLDEYYRLWDKAPNTATQRAELLAKIAESYFKERFDKAVKKMEVLSVFGVNIISSDHIKHEIFGSKE